jgi:hypothetical protein
LWKLKVSPNRCPTLGALGANQACLPSMWHPVRRLRGSSGGSDARGPDRLGGQVELGGLSVTGRGVLGAGVQIGPGSRA